MISDSIFEHTNLIKLMATMNADKLLKVRMILNLLVVTMKLDLTVFHADYRVCKVDEVNGVGYQHSGFLRQLSHQHLLKNFLLYVCVLS